MRKSSVYSILPEYAKRRFSIISQLCLIIFISIMAFLLYLIYFSNLNGNYATYSENSDISYKVYLKDNKYFENNYLDSDNQYIASLIDNIKAKFEYELYFEEEANVEYKYEYKIDANVKIYDKDTKQILFKKTVNMLPMKKHVTTDLKTTINEDIDIDYNYYNDLIKEFVTVYDLYDAVSELSIDMVVNTFSTCNGSNKVNTDGSTMSMVIPLTTKTVAIEVANDLIESENNIMLCEVSKLNYLLLVLAILVTISVFVLIWRLVKFERSTRTVNTVYLKKLKHILNNYGAYIQEIADDFDVKGYQLVKIMSFEDLLEIRDTIRQPILMKQSRERNSAYFLIPSTSRYLFVYRLKVKSSDLKIYEEKIIVKNTNKKTTKKVKEEKTKEDKFVSSEDVEVI